MQLAINYSGVDREGKQAFYGYQWWQHSLKRPLAGHGTPLVSYALLTLLLFKQHKDGAQRNGWEDSNSGLAIGQFSARQQLCSRPPYEMIEVSPAAVAHRRNPGPLRTFGQAAGR